MNPRAFALGAAVACCPAIALGYKWLVVDRQSRLVEEYTARTGEGGDIGKMLPHINRTSASVSAGPREIQAMLDDALKKSTRQNISTAFDGAVRTHAFGFPAGGTTEDAAASSDDVEV